MMKSHAIGIERRAKEKWTRSKRLDLRSGVLLALGLLGLPTADAASLKEVGYSALPGNAVQITLTADGPITYPTSFATQNPARIAIDLPGVHNALRNSSQPVGIASVRSLEVVESGDRTRVVINLIENVPHSIDTQGNRLVVSVNTRSAARAMANGPAPRTTSRFAPTIASSPITIAPPPDNSIQDQPPTAMAATHDSAMTGPAPRVAPAPRVTPVVDFDAPQTGQASGAASSPAVEAPPVIIPPPAPIITADAAANPQDATPPPTQRPAPKAPSFVDLPGPTPSAPASETAYGQPAPAAPTPPVAAPSTDSPTIAEHSMIEPSSRHFGSGMGVPGISDIDFRRGDAGEGRIIFTLSDPSIVVDVREEVGHVLMDFLKTTTAERLQRRFDVTDFDTPVKMFEVDEKDGGVHVNIASRSEFEYLAYQTDDLFTVEFRPLSKEEKDELKKKQIGYTGDRLSLNFQDIEVRSVLQLLGDFTGLNMVVSDTVTGNITLRLQNVPWDQALDIILKTKGLAKRENDNVVMIAPAEELAEQEKKELEAMKDKQELAPLHSEFFQLNYASASAVATLLKSKETMLLTPERGQVSFDERTNLLMVQDTDAKLQEIQRLLLKLDIAVRQVMIESRIVVATDSFTKDLGVRLGFSRSNNVNGTEVNIGGGLSGGVEGTDQINDGYFSTNNDGTTNSAGITVDGAEGLMVNLPAAVGSTGSVVNLLVSKVGSYLLQLELSAMQQEGKGEVISSPRVVTSDKTKATITQGIEIPYQTVSDGGTNTEFKTAALTLDVTPSITPDDRVMMDLNVSKDTPNATLQTDAGVPVDKRNIVTKVTVDNGDTIVLGGVYEREATESIDKIPTLGDLPIIGLAFRRQQNIETNRELLVFVTPKILKEQLGMR